MRTFTMSDCHGGHKAMLQCFERANFDYQNDKLIFNGDVNDGWDQTYECLEELMKIKNLVFVSGNHDCLSTDTECLTQEGWKKYDQLKRTDLIFSLDVKTGLGQWDNINEIIIKETEAINFIENHHFSLACTDNHRILSEKRVRRSKKQQWLDFSYETIKNIPGRRRFPVSARQAEETGLPISDFELKIAAWILTDGGLSRQKESHVGCYNIYQSNHVEYLKKLISSIGYKYSLSSRDRNIVEICGRSLLKKPKKSYTFSFLSEANKKIKEYLPNKYPFPINFFKMSSRQFDIFLKEMLMADGTIRDGYKSSCLYGAREFLSNIQALCVSNGYRAVLAEDNRGDYRLNISEYQSTQIDIYKKDIIREEKKQKVWCLSVPLTNFMVRRNGKAFFTGNSWLKHWLKNEKDQPRVWTRQGGQNTLLSYSTRLKKDKKRHLDFLKSAKHYYLDEKNRLFVHGGIDLTLPIDKQAKMTLMWDRSFWNYKDQRFSIKPYSEIYVGHTSVWRESKVPVTYNKITFCDTGGGYEGKLSLLNIDTKEVFQSDMVRHLYAVETFLDLWRDL